VTGPLSERDAQAWVQRAEDYIGYALAHVRSGDVIPQLEAAIQCQRIAAGEADPSTMDDPEPPCTCPPGLVARGGFRSTCLAHGGGA
jgi:hypothetical protein